MNINPFQLLQNPQQILTQLFGNNPMVNNLTKMINNHDSKGIEEMARNLAKEKGLNADELFKQYKSKLGM